MSLREGKIGTSEGIALLTSAMLSKLLVPLFSSGASTTAWLANIAAALAAAAAFLLALYLIRGDSDLLGGMHEQLGFGGRAFALALSALLIFSAARALSAFHLTLRTFIYTETDPLILMGVIVIAAAVPAYMGFECVSRTAKAFFAIMLFVLACVFVFPWKQYELSRLFPIFGAGAKSVLISGVSGSAVYLDLIGATALAKALHGKKQVRRIGIRALGVSVFASTLMLLAAALTFSSGMLSEMTAPFYPMASGITSGATLTRIEDFIVIIWMLCMCAGISFTLYLASNVFCSTFRITEIRPVVPLVCFIALSVALLTQTSATAQNAERFISKYGVIFAYCPIALAALIALIKRRRKAGRAKESPS